MLILLLILAICCQKNDNADKHLVYVGGELLNGHDGKNIVIWKGDSLIRLPDTMINEIAGIKLDLTNEYIAGTRRILEKASPTMLLNRKEINSISNTNNEIANCFDIENGRTYMGGNRKLDNGQSLAVIWINNAPMIISDAGETSVYAIKVINNTIYSGGKDNSHSGVGIDYPKPCIWIGDRKTELVSNNQSIGAVLGIDVRDNQIHSVGYIFEGSIFYVTYWINNTLQKIDSSSLLSKANDIFIDNNDVYIIYTKNARAYLWKNGISEILDSYGLESEPTDLYVLDNVSYISGYIGTGTKQPIYWRSKHLIKLPNPNMNYGSADIIFVSNRN